MLLTFILILLLMFVLLSGFSMWAQQSGYTEQLLENGRRLQTRTELAKDLDEYRITCLGYLEAYLDFTDVPLDTRMSRSILLGLVEEGDQEALELLPEASGGFEYLITSKSKPSEIQGAIDTAKERLLDLATPEREVASSYQSEREQIRSEIESISFLHAIRHAVPPIEERVPELAPLHEFKMNLRADHADLKDRVYFMTLLTTGEFPVTEELA